MLDRVEFDSGFTKKVKHQIYIHMLIYFSYFLFQFEGIHVMNNQSLILVAFYLDNCSIFQWTDYRHHWKIWKVSSYVILYY